MELLWSTCCCWWVGGGYSSTRGIWEVVWLWSSRSTCEVVEGQGGCQGGWSTLWTDLVTDPSPAKTGTGTSRVTFFSPVPVPVTPVPAIPHGSGFPCPSLVVLAPLPPIYKCKFVLPSALFTNPAPLFNPSPMTNLFFHSIYIYSQVCCSLFSSHLKIRHCLSFTNTARFVVPSSLLIYKCGTIYLQICSSSTIYWSSSFTNTTRFVVPPSLPIYKWGFFSIYKSHMVC